MTAHRQSHLRPQPTGRPALAAFVALVSSLILLPAARSTTVIPPEFDALVHEADAIVRGHVVDVRSEWDLSGGHRRIVTFVTVAVLETLAGDPAPNEIVLRFLGGTVGDVTMHIPGQPQFKPGDEDFLFVQGNGRQWSPLVAVMHGRYPIERDAATGREVVLRANRVPLEHVDEVSLPMVGGDAARLQRLLKRDGLTPAAFSRLVREERQRTAGSPSNP